MKNVIITGASFGIGKEIADHLSSKYHIINIDIQRDNEQLKNRSYYECDLRDKSMLKKTLATIMEKFDTLYALINNAGQFSQIPLFEQSDGDWEKIIALNLSAPYYLSKSLSPLLSASKGHIINISSTRALMSEYGTEPYSASKGGLNALTHAMAISLSHQVHVNAISLGWINTNNTYIPTQEDHLQHPSSRVGEPKDIALMVEFLLSQENSFITGSNFVVDGGMTKKMIYHE